MASVKSSLDRLMLSLEEEAREYVRFWLRKYGINMKPKRLFICDMEINLFDSTEKYILLGDATVRAGPQVVRWIYGRAKKLVKCAPEFKDKDFIVVIYAMHFTPDAISEADKYGIWLISATEEHTKFRKIKLKE